MAKGVRSLHEACWEATELRREVAAHLFVLCEETGDFLTIAMADCVRRRWPRPWPFLTSTTAAIVGGSSAAL